MILSKSLSLHPHFQIIGMILCIETSTSNCSVALCDRQGVIALRNNKGSQSHATELTVFIEDLLKDADIKASQLEAIAVSKGPGSYTGLRIGVSTAKGIAFGASIPIIGIETTLSMFYGFLIYFNGKYDFAEKPPASEAVRPAKAPAAVPPDAKARLDADIGQLLTEEFTP